MNAMTKWIGGLTAVALVVLGTLVFTGQRLESTAVDPDQWLNPGDPLAETTAAAKSYPVSMTLPAATPVAKPAETPFVIKRILPIEGAIRYGEWHWDETGAPAGPIVVTIDLEARVMSVFRAGYEIGAAAVMLGTDEHPTPTGVFPILSKERHNKSEKYGDAPMPWTLRLTNDGVAIHGGRLVERGYASHGCIGTPDAFVSKLFAIASMGDKVIITRGKSAAMGDRLI